MIRFEVLSQQATNTYWVALFGVNGFTGTNMMVYSETSLGIGQHYEALISGRANGVTTITDVTEF